MVGLFYDCKSIILETYIICISSFLSNEQVVSLKHNVCLCQLCSVISQLSLLTRPTQWTITFTLLHIMVVVGALKKHHCQWKMTHNIIKGQKASMLIVLCLCIGQLEAILNCMDFTSLIFYSQKCAKNGWFVGPGNHSFRLTAFLPPIFLPVRIKCTLVLHFQWAHILFSHWWTHYGSTVWVFFCLGASPLASYHQHSTPSSGV